MGRRVDTRPSPTYYLRRVCDESVARGTSRSTLRRPLVSRSLAQVALPLGLNLAALGATALLHPIAATGMYLPFLSAVVVASAVSGLRAGLVTALTGILCVDFFFLLPPGTLSVLASADAVMLTVFGGMAALVAWLTGRVRAEREAAREAALRAAAINALLTRQLDETEEQARALAHLTGARPLDPERAVN